MALRTFFTRAATGLTLVNAYYRIGEFRCSVRRRKARIEIDVYVNRQAFLDGLAPESVLAYEVAGQKFVDRIERPSRAMIYALIKEDLLPDASDDL